MEQNHKPAKEQFDDNSIKTLEWNEHIQRRSEMYIGQLVDMEDFIQSHPDIDYWIFGHTYYNGNNKILAEGGLTIGRTRLVTNQLGYVQHNEQNGFRPEAIISEFSMITNDPE